MPGNRFQESLRSLETGVGKTSISYFLAQELMNHHMHPLLIDADFTTSHLTRALGISPPTTIEHLRRDLIGVAARGDPDIKKSAGPVGRPWRDFTM